jgi:glycosyltransferase involved in cell wall biosynthesis
MRILICIATMEGGGAERQVTYLARALVEAGEDVHVALIRGGVNLDRLTASGATVHFVGIYPRSFRFVIPLMRLLRRLRPDIIYLWQRPFDVLGAIACLGSSAACVQAERTRPGKLPRGMKAGLRRLLVPFALGVISNSEAGQAYWLHRLLPRGRAAMIPNIVPIDELAAVAPADVSRGGHCCREAGLIEERADTREGRCQPETAGHRRVAVDRRRGPAVQHDRHRDCRRRTE